MISIEAKPAGEQMINIRLKHGSNVTMHSIDMPLVAINSFISIEYEYFKLPNFIFNRPYSDYPNADIKGNLTNVTI